MQVRRFEEHSFNELQKTIPITVSRNGVSLVVTSREHNKLIACREAKISLQLSKWSSLSISMCLTPLCSSMLLAMIVAASGVQDPTAPPTMGGLGSFGGGPGGLFGGGGGGGDPAPDIVDGDRPMSGLADDENTFGSSGTFSTALEGEGDDKSSGGGWWPFGGGK